MIDWLFYQYVRFLLWLSPARGVRWLFSDRARLRRVRRAIADVPDPHP